LLSQHSQIKGLLYLWGVNCTLRLKFLPSLGSVNYSSNRKAFKMTSKWAEYWEVTT